MPIAAVASRPDAPTLSGADATSLSQRRSKTTALSQQGAAAAAAPLSPRMEARMRAREKREADAERRCASLAYKAAALEAELDQYRDYMKKTVRRYQRHLRIGADPTQSSSQRPPPPVANR